MSKEKFEIELSEGVELILHEFYQYDPETEYSAELSAQYLQEDLVQVDFLDQNLTVDLGWYGDTATNVGIFKLYLIIGIDWDNPVFKVESKSAVDIYDKMLKMIEAID